MFFKMIVFNSDDSVYDGRRDFVEADGPPVLFRTQLADRLAVAEVGESGDFVMIDFLFNIGT
ncbi:hypothetical protein D3C73_1621970 [compost metagenome]